MKEAAQCLSDCGRIIEARVVAGYPVGPNIKLVALQNQACFAQ